MQRLLVALGFSFFATLAVDVESAQDCARASDELKAAQAVLADATRKADEAGAAFHGCMQKNKNDARTCSNEKKALESSLACKRHARGAYNAAVEKKRQSCH